MLLLQLDRDPHLIPTIVHSVGTSLFVLHRVGGAQPGRARRRLPDDDAGLRAGRGDRAVRAGRRAGHPFRLIAAATVAH